LLGAAGMLDGRRVTTHWRVALELQKMYPAARVEPDRIYVRDANIWTSGGVSAGIDLALALISEDCGDKVARRVAQQMVVYYRRPGGQSQFSVLAELGGGDSAFSSLLSWIRANLSEELSVEQLASQVAMSPRNFSRAFAKAMGITPAKAVERLRLEAARERIEYSRDLVSDIAASTGFGDIETMRRSFVRIYGRTPQELRRTTPGS
jgi:transcriptional regulator GlxA family with amidase domain